MIYLIVPKIILAIATGVLAPVLVTRLFRLTGLWSVGVWLAGLLVSVVLCFLKSGPVSTTLVIPWLVAIAAVSLAGVKRLAVWLLDDVGLFLVFAGCGYLAVGGVWLLASTLTGSFLDFYEPWKTLTAVHFHFAAFLLPVATGLLLCRNSYSRPQLRLFRVIAIAYLIGIALVAVGLAGVRPVELVGTTLFSGSGIALLVFLWIHAHASGSVRVILRIGIIAGVLGLLLSLLYGWRFGPLVSFDVMAMSHGVLNGMILTPALVYAALKNVPAFDLSRPIPFSNLRGTFRIGPDFFARYTTSTNSRPSGLVSDFRIFDRNGFTSADIDPRVRDFYENTLGYDLEVRVTRAWWFRILWDWLIGPLFHAVGQLDLPSRDKSIDGQLVRLDPDSDGRTAPVGWIRTDAVSGEAVYMAAYSTHMSDSTTYMNIAFPLPLSNMTSVLHLTSLPERQGLTLTSRHETNSGGDQGVYICTRFADFRLPLNETIEVWYDDLLRARHQMWIFGLQYMTLDYVMPRMQKESEHAQRG